MLGQNFVKYFFWFLDNGVSRKSAFDIYWPLDITAVYSFFYLSSYVISRYWVVFSVHDDSIPFLELWAEPTEVASKPPQFMFPLAVCQHISPSLGKSLKTVWQIFWRLVEMAWSQNFFHFCSNLPKNVPKIILSIFL